MTRSAPRFNERSPLPPLSTTPRLARDVHCSSWNSPRDLRVTLPTTTLGRDGGGGGEVGKNVNCATTMGSILSFVTAVRCPLGLVLNIDIERAGADRDRSMTNRGGFEEWPAPRCFFFFSFFYFPS